MSSTISSSSSGTGLASTGVGSGLDVNSIVSKLMAVEQQPLTLLQNKASTLSTELSTYGTVKSQIASLQDAATTLMDSTGWSGRTLSSSNTSAVNGTAADGATPGTYDVTVTQLAQLQTNYSGGITSGSAIGSSGTLTISLGTWSGNTWTQSSANPSPTVSIGATDTMPTIASKINAANAGVNASVVTANGKEQLIIRGNSTGAAQGFRIDATDGSNTAITNGTGVGMFAYAPGTVTTGGLNLNQAAQDAQANIDGIAVSSATNTITQAIPNVTLTLSQVSASPITVTVANDSATQKKNIQAFVNAYNTLQQNLSTQTAYDASSKTAGPLQGDSTAVGILNTLSRMVGAVGPSGTNYTRLSDIGIQIQANGTLSVNDTKLTAALANPSSMQTFFGASSSDPTTTGMARRFYNFAFGANSASGNITTISNSLQKRINQTNTDISKMNDRLSAYQTRLYSQYTALDSKMATLNSLSSYVSQQITTWNNSKG